MLNKIYKSHPVSFPICLSILILFICSSVRHALFQSTAYDLGIYDQGVYLISQGIPAISSFLNFNIIASHGALILYPLALFYKLYPDVHWLLIIQAVALSLGALFTYLLAKEADLKETQAKAMLLVYLLYPGIFNVNLFDFHPEVIALPAILAAVWAAIKNYLNKFILAIILILSCKEILSLSVAAMGFWLLFFEKKRLYGTIALVAGSAWFICVTNIIIPFFGNETGTVERHISRFSHLGQSFREIITNFIFKPQLLLSTIFQLANLEYLVLLLIPLIWGLSWRHLAPLVGAIPILAINLLSNLPSQKDLIHHYFIPILPFLLLAVISSLAANKGWFKQPKNMVLWVLVAFVALAKYGYYGSIYLQSLDNWQATREAMEYIQTQEEVFTYSQLAPHLTHRRVVTLATEESKEIDLKQFKYILLNQRHPGWQSSSDLVINWVNKLKQIPEFKLIYEKNEVFLFKK